MHDLHIFVTVQLLEDTPAALSLLASFASTVTCVSGPVVVSHV